MQSSIKTLLGWGTMAAVLMVVGTGCSHQSDHGQLSSTPEATLTSSTSGQNSIDTSKYVLTDEPDGAVSVISARAEAQDGDEIVLMGRIGGSKKPWIDGRGAFMVIDASKMVVADGKESGGAELCLDDCCASLRAECTTLVKIVDEQGTVLRKDARKIIDADVNDLVVVRGHIERDEEQGTFVLIANGVHVRR